MLNDQYMKLRGALFWKEPKFLALSWTLGFHYSAGRIELTQVQKEKREEKLCAVAARLKQRSHKSKRKSTSSIQGAGLFCEVRFAIFTEIVEPSIMRGKCYLDQVYWKSVFDTSQASTRKVSEWLLLMFTWVVQWGGHHGSPLICQTG